MTGAAAPSANADQLALLEADITKQRATVAERKAAVDEMRDGTIRTERLAAMRLAETTLALLERRHLALKHGITLSTVPTPATAIPAADKDAIAALEADIAERRRVIADTQKDADQYSGGLIKVTLLQRLATEQTRLAAPEQGLLSLKHGLPPAPGLTRVASIAVAPEVPAPLDADIVATRAFRPRKDYGHYIQTVNPFACGRAGISARRASHPSQNRPIVPNTAMASIAPFDHSHRNHAGICLHILTCR